jgi:hypothetical protein
VDLHGEPASPEVVASEPSVDLGRLVPLLLVGLVPGEQEVAGSYFV